MALRWLKAVVAALSLVLAVAPAGAGDFIDAAGRHVVLPDHITRVLPAQRNAEVMAFVLAPDKLVGLEPVGLAKPPPPPPPPRPPPPSPPPPTPPAPPLH